MARYSYPGRAQLKVVSRRDPPLDTRRTSILEAAMAVIAREGLTRTTIEKVAERAGVSPGTVTFHFTSKEKLLIAALDAVSTEFGTARRAVIARAGGDPAMALIGLIDLTFDPKQTSGDRIAVWYAFWGEAWARDIYKLRVGKSDAAYQRDVVAIVTNLIQQGAYRGLDAEAVATGFAGLLEWQWQSILTEGRRFDRKRAMKQARAYLAGHFPRHFPADVPT